MRIFEHPYNGQTLPIAICDRIRHGHMVQEWGFNMQGLSLNDSDPRYMCRDSSELFYDSGGPGPGPGPARGMHGIGYRLWVYLRLRRLGIVG